MVITRTKTNVGAKSGSVIQRNCATAGFEDIVEIGRGGFGIVYRCAQPLLDRAVAVKVLTAALNPQNLERFLREQHAMGRLSGHLHIVTILQVGTTASGWPFIVIATIANVWGNWSLAAAKILHHKVIR